MSSIITRCLLLLNAFIVFTLPATAQDRLAAQYDSEVRLTPKKVGDAIGTARKVANDYVDNLDKCVGSGHTLEECVGAAAYCTLNENFPWGKIPYAGVFISELGLGQLGKAYCGQGTCFQCCFTGAGCHSSFVGFPVINCNKNYGPLTSAVGLTLVVDPDAEPGQACLFTPQTCDHIAACNPEASKANSSSSQDVLHETLFDPDPIMSAPHAKDQRRMVTADQLGYAFLRIMNRYGTSLSDSVVAETVSPRVFTDFLTGRGCTEWRSLVSASEPGWASSPFAVESDSGMVSEPLSRLAGISQIARARMMASLPNFYARLDSVESRVWSFADKEAYLASVIDPDQAILERTSSLTLDALQSISAPPLWYLQDYTLLTAPLPDEAPLPTNVYNGCTLGSAPIMKVDKTGTDASQTTITVIPIADGAEWPIDVVIMWGDGTTSSASIDSFDGASFSHTYANAGAYQVFVVGQGDSGLRGITGLTVDAAQGPIEAARLSVSRVELHGIEGAVSGGLIILPEINVSFDLYGVDESGARELIGRMSPTLKESGKAGPFQTDAVIGHVPAILDIDRLLIDWTVPYEPSTARFLKGGTWTLGGLTLYVWDPNRDELVPIDVALSPDMIRLQTPAGADETMNETIETGDQGGLTMPLYTATNVEKLTTEIAIPDSVLVRAPILSADGASFDPLVGRWVEVRPEIYEEAPLLTSNQEADQPEIPFTVSVFPNPVGTSGTITFTVDRTGPARLVLYDVLGREVAVLLDQPVTPGIYEVPLERGALSAGIYFIRLSHNWHVAQKSIVLR